MTAHQSPAPPRGRVTSQGTRVVDRSNDHIVELRDISKEFTGGTLAVDRVTLAVEPGGVFGIVGHSGAGKSTLLRLINLLETPTTGTVTVDGQDLTALGSRQLRAARRDIGMVFQQFNLFRPRTVLGNVAYPLRLSGASRTQARDRAQEALRFVGLADQARRYPEQLSGGQRQRVGIARALATRPRLLLCDEATSALDPQTTQEVLALLRRINDELGVTIVLITHEMAVVRALCDRMAVMDAGRIVETGPVRELFAAPQHPTTRAFVRSAVQASPLLDLLPAALRRHGVDEAVAASVLAEVST